jgi:predicted NBD/HSP70 family sugar kinase
MDMKSAGRNDLRSRNTHLLLHLIQVNGPVSQADLARRSGLSRSTVSGIINPLIENSLIVTTGKNKKQGMGRRASLLTFSPETLMTVGVVIEPDQCKIALIDFSGTVIGSTDLTCSLPCQPEQVAICIKADLEKLLQECDVQRDAIVGIGVALPGMIDVETGTVKVAINLGWANVPLKQIIEIKLELPVSIENVANAKIATETIWGRGVDCENLVLLEIGSGIGGGALVDNHLINGATFAAAEVGHTSLDLNGPQCQCGLQGCWEVFCNGPAIRARIKKYLTNYPDIATQLNPDSSLRDLQEVAEADDELALMVIQETARYMARGFVNILYNFDPEMLILTGYIVEECPFLIESTQEELKKIQAIRSMAVPLLKAKQGDNFGVISASALVSRKYLEELSYFSS